MDTKSNEDTDTPVQQQPQPQQQQQQVVSNNTNTSNTNNSTTSASGRGFVTNSTLHKQISLIVGILKRNSSNVSICKRALHALLLVLREDGATCCRQYEEVLVSSMVIPLSAHPEDPGLCETALSALVVLSESTTLSRSESTLTSVIIRLLEHHTEHSRAAYLLLCVLNNLSIDNLVSDFCSRFTSAFVNLLNNKECIQDTRFCAALLGAICNCSQCISPVPKELVEAVVGALKCSGGDNSVLRVAAMTLGNFVRQGEPTTSAVLETCAVGHLAGFLHGNCRAMASGTEKNLSCSNTAALYAIIAEVIGDIAAEAYAEKDPSSAPPMEDVVITMLDVVKMHAGGTKACVQALRALRILCAGSIENRKIAIQNSGIDIMLNAGKKNLSRTALCVGAMRVLQNMVLVDSAQKMARKEGAIKFAEEALKTFSKVPMACYHVMGLIASLTISEKNKKTAMEAGIIELIVDTIAYFRDTDPRICEQGCLVLSVITTNFPDGQKIAIQKSAIELLTDLLRIFCGINYRVCAMACRALQQIVTCNDFFQILELSSKNARDITYKIIFTIIETMNMNNDDPRYCLEASKTLVNITSKKIQCNEKDNMWLQLIESIEETFYINQNKLSTFDTLSASLLNMYVNYAHEIIASKERLPLCVSHVLDILRYYRGNKYICTKSLAFFEVMLDGSSGVEPLNEVRFLLWKEGFAKLIGSALLIHEKDNAMSSSVKRILDKIGNNVFSDWLQCIGATKAPFKKEFEYSEVVSMGKSRLMWNGIFLYAIILDHVTYYEIWRSAGFVITKIDNPLYWERFVSQSIAAEVTLANMPKIKITGDNISSESAVNISISSSSSPCLDDVIPMRKSSIDNELGGSTRDTYKLLSESKEYFAALLNESQDSFMKKVEKASSFVSYMIASHEISLRIAEWELTRNDVLAIAFYRLDFASTTTKIQNRFSFALNVSLVQNKNPEQLASFSLTPMGSFYKLLECALSKIPFYEGKVYHVFRRESRSEFKAFAKTGAPFTWSPIMSTTTNFDASKRLCIDNDYTLAVITVKKAHKTDTFTLFPALRDEGEVLISPRSTFKVSRDVYWDPENKLYLVDIDEI